MALYARVAQLDRALACGAKGRRFESYHAYHKHKLFDISNLSPDNYRMKNQKGFGLIEGMIAALVIAVIGFGGFFCGKHSIKLNLTLFYPRHQVQNQQ